MPAVVRPGEPFGPLVHEIIPRLDVWLREQRYAASTSHQVLTVAGWLSAWMAEKARRFRSSGPMY